MPACCSVVSCRNIKRKHDELHFFNFPKEPSIRSIWIRRCSKDDSISKKINAGTGRVCSDHFQQTDFTNWTEHKLMGTSKLFLKKNAVPSQNLPYKVKLYPQHSRSSGQSNLKDKVNTDDGSRNVLDIKKYTNTEYKVQNKDANNCSSSNTADISNTDKKRILPNSSDSINNLNAIEIYEEIEEISSETIAESRNKSFTLSKKTTHIPLPKYTKLLLLDSKELNTKNYQQAYRETKAKSITNTNNSDQLCDETEITKCTDSVNSSDVIDRFPKEVDKSLSKPLKSTDDSNILSKEVQERLSGTATKSTDSSNISTNNKEEALSEATKGTESSDRLIFKKTEGVSSESTKGTNNSDKVCRETKEVSATPIKVLLLTTNPLITGNSSKEAEQLKQQITTMQKQINALKEENNKFMMLKTENEKNAKKLKLLERQLKRANECNLKKSRNALDAEVRKLLSKMFTETQMKLLLEKQKRVFWSEKDIAIAFTILYSSKHCYNFLREKLNYPLPGLSTLRRWTQKLRLKKGCLNGMIKLLEIAGSRMSNLDKLVVLQYGKLTVAEKYEYDEENDEVIGPHKYMQVVIARSLCGKWIQPIFADFDKRIATTLLSELFVKLHDIGFRVVACVSDSGLANARLWTVLGITWEKPWINHPCIDDKKIYFFADASHMLKLLRNWLLDTGFVLKNGANIGHTPLIELLSDTVNTEENTFGVTIEEIDCHGSQRDDISLATQLFSPAVSYALKYSANKESEYDDLAEFIDIIHNWYDIMDSSLSTATLPSKGGYGKFELKSYQDDCLDKAFETVFHMRCISEKKLMKFQDGILFSIKSLQQLFTDLKEEFNIRYILTNKLNLSALEHLFSQLKGQDGCATPLDVLNGLRKTVLGTTNTSSSTPTEQEHEAYIVSKVLNGTGLDIFGSSDRSNNQNVQSTLDDEASIIFQTDNAQSEEDCCNDCAGWIVKRLHETHPHLGVPSYGAVQMETEEHLYYIPSHIEPTQEFLNEVKDLNKLFCKYTETQFVNIKNIAKRIVKDISHHSKSDIAIIEAFVRQKILRKINYLNFQLVQNNANNGKRKLVDQKTPKTAKKLKQFAK